MVGIGFVGEKLRVSLKSQGLLPKEKKHPGQPRCPLTAGAPVGCLEYIYIYVSHVEASTRMATFILVRVAGVPK